MFYKIKPHIKLIHGLPFFNSRLTKPDTAYSSANAVAWNLA